MMLSDLGASSTIAFSFWKLNELYRLQIFDKYYIAQSKNITMYNLFKDKWNDTNSV